jgi:replication factor C small subunit
MSSHYSELWVEKYRPHTLEDVILSDDVREHFKRLTEDTPHILFYGPPGTGKSTMAKIIVKDILKCQYLYINASDENGIDTIRNKVISFAQTRSIDGKKKVVILEEADGLTGDSLRILRNVMEEYVDTTRFILTANYFNRIIEAITSRCQLFKLQPDLKGIVQRCVDILKAEKVSVEEKQRYLLLSRIEKNGTDLRRTINDLQKFCVTGSLLIPDENQITNLANFVISGLINKNSVLEIRKKVIETEKTFNADYQQLLKEMFELIYNSEIPVTQKKTIMLDLGEYMYRDCQVIDKEINFFCCLLSIENVIKN